MSDFVQLLKHNRNYRYTWAGQVVSEIGDHFNNIAVFSLALAVTHSGMVVTGVMLSRAIPAVMAGPGIIRLYGDGCRIEADAGRYRMQFTRN